jgi:hypothetical protein
MGMDERTAVSRAESQPGTPTVYDSSSRPEVFSRVLVKRSCTSAQFVMFQNAFT